MRAAKPRTLEALLQALKVALQTITKKDAVAWFTHCGYWVEALRPDAWRIGNIPTAQIISVVLIVIGIVLLLARHLKRRTLKPAESGWAFFFPFLNLISC